MGNDASTQIHFRSPYRSSPWAVHRRVAASSPLVSGGFAPASYPARTLRLEMVEKARPEASLPHSTDATFWSHHGSPTLRRPAAATSPTWREPRPSPRPAWSHRSSARAGNHYCRRQGRLHRCVGGLWVWVQRLPQGGLKVAVWSWRQSRLPAQMSLPHQAGVGGEKAGRPDPLAGCARREGRTLKALPDTFQTRRLAQPAGPGRPVVRPPPSERGTVLDDGKTNAGRGAPTEPNPARQAV